MSTSVTGFKSVDTYSATEFSLCSSPSWLAHLITGHCRMQLRDGSLIAGQGVEEP
jgi:hypothetical protein